MREIHREDYLQEQPLTESSKALQVETISIGQVKDLEPISEHLSDDRRVSTKLTLNEIERLKKELHTMLYFGPGASLPMICAGPKCCMAKSCYLEEIGKSPIGSRCPLELAKMNKWKDDYLVTLGASWENKIERQAIIDLVETEIMRSRANGIIATEGFIMENVIGVNSETGEPIYTKQKHVALEVSDQMSKRQERILRSLVATREMQEKLGKNKTDPNKKESELIDRVRKAIARDKAKGATNAEVITSSEKDNSAT
jgi:hypothetical protein